MYMKFPLKVEKITRNVKSLRFKSRNNNNNWLPSKVSGWLANPGGMRFSKPIKEISQEELNACLHVCFYASARTSVTKVHHSVKSI